MDLIKQFKDIVVLGRLEHEFIIYGEKETHKVRLGLLDDGEMDGVIKGASGLDAFARERYIRKEILVHAVMSIDGLDLTPEETKEELRQVLDRCSIAQTDHLYVCYNDLRLTSDLMVAEKLGKGEAALKDIVSVKTSSEKEEEKSKEEKKEGEGEDRK